MQQLYNIVYIAAVYFRVPAGRLAPTGWGCLRTRYQHPLPRSPAGGGSDTGPQTHSQSCARSNTRHRSQVQLSWTWELSV